MPKFTRSFFQYVRAAVLIFMVLSTLSSAQVHHEAQSSSTGGGYPPAAPTGLSAEGGYELANLVWNASSGATSYTVLRSPSGNSGTFSSVGSATTTSYTDTGLSDGTTYYFEVKASNSFGTSGPSNVASALTIPPVPSGVAAEGSPTVADRINVGWNSSLSATNYIALYSTSSNGTYSTLGQTTSTSCYATGLANGTTYYFEVKAQNASGISAASTAASALTLPPVPTGVSAQGGNLTATVSCNASQSATSYTVLMSTSSAGPFSSAGTFASSPFSITGLQAGTYYYFEVEATNATGTSSPSTAASALTAPIAPPNLAAQLVSGNVVLTWSASPTATQYHVMRKLQSDGAQIVGDTSALTITDPTPPPNTYTYLVYAENATGYGSPASVTITVPINSPILTAVGGNGFVSLSWTTPATAVSYVLTKSTQPTTGFSQIYSGSGNTFGDTNVVNGTTYYYQVTAYDGSGNPSLGSNVASATPQASSTVLMTPNEVVSVGGGGGSGPKYTNTPLTLPDWESSTIPFDEGDAPGGGPSSTYSVSVPYGVMESDCGPDIVSRNTIGPDVAFERTYRTALANAGISSDGLPAGWVTNWDFKVFGNGTGQWGNLLLVYPKGASDVLVPTMQQQEDGSLYPTGAFTVPANAPYSLTGTADPNNPGNWINLTFKTGAVSQVVYGPFGSVLRPTQFTNEQSQSIMVEYPNNVFGDIKDSNGNVLLQATYNSNNQLASITDSNGRTVSYTYASGSTGAELTAVSLVNSQSVAWQYAYVSLNGAQYLNTVSTNGGQGFQGSGVVYDTYGRVSTVTDADGSVRTYTYNVSVGGQTNNTGISVSSPSWGTFESWTQAFDGNARSLGSTNSAGGSTVVSYQTPTSPVPQTVNPVLQNSQSIGSDQYGHVTQYTDSYGCSFGLGYHYDVNPFGRLDHVTETGTDGTVRTTATFAYDNNGRISSVQVPAPGSVGGTGGTNTISYTYTGVGNLATVTEPGPNGPIIYTFNYPQTGEVLGEPQSVTGPAPSSGQAAPVTQFAYDYLGRVASTTDPMLNVTRYNFTNEDLSSVQFPSPDSPGNTSDYLSLYYSNGSTKAPSEVSLTSGSNSQQVLQYLSQYTPEFSPSYLSGNTDQQYATYNPEHLLTQIVNGNGAAAHQFVYNPTHSGGPQTQTQEGQNTWTTNYDKSFSALNATDPNGSSTTVVRGYGDNRPTEVTSPDEDITYAYDGFGRVKQASDSAAATSVSYTYDDQDNVLTEIKQGASTFSGTTITYTYYPNGERQSMSFSASLLGGAAQTYSYQYSYDNDGNLTNISLRAGNTSTDANVAYTYDLDGRVTHMSTAYSDTYYVYDGLGNVTELDNMSPSSMPQGYPVYTAPVAGAVSESVISRYYGMTYDVGGNRTLSNIQMPSLDTNYDYSGKVTFTYDNNELMNEVWQFTYQPQVANLYNYDSGGNAGYFRSQTFAYDQSQDQLTSASLQNISSAAPFGFENGTYAFNNNGTTQGYDNNGNLIGFTDNNHYTRALTYDLEGQMTSIGFGGNGIKSQNTYQIDGLRDTHTPLYSSGTYSFLYDGTALLGASYTGAGGDNTAEGGLFIWGPTGVAMCYLPSGSIAYAYDPSGNRVGAVSADNGPSDSNTVYDAFGEYFEGDYHISGEQNSNYENRDICNLIGYKGQTGSVSDWDTGLLYCQARYYSILFGRWITRDPLGYEGGLNVYEFCGNNPLMFSDPSGLSGGALAEKALEKAVELRLVEGGAGRVLVVMTNPAGWCLFAAQVGWGVGTAIDQHWGISERYGADLGGLTEAEVAADMPDIPNLYRMWRNGDELQKAELEAQYSLVARYASFHKSKDGVRLHHLLPQQFRGWFEKRGINIDSNSLLYPMEPGPHLDIHGRGGTVITAWNGLWERYIEKNPGASAEEIFQQLSKMMKDHGLN